MKSFCNLLLSSVAAFTLAACSSSAPVPEGASQKVTSPLLGAATDTGHTFSVGFCGGGLKPGVDQGSQFCKRDQCSATLIAPNVVLTAQHCVNDIAYAADYCASTFAGPLFPGVTPLITTSLSGREGSPTWYTVKSVHVPTGNTLCHDDIALLVLDTPIPSSEARPVKVDLDRNVARRPPGEVAVVGRGMSGFSYDLTTGGVIVTDTGGFERRLAEHIPFLCASSRGEPGCTVVDYTSPPTNEFTAPYGWFVTGGIVAPGDSGAGVFDQSSFGREPRVIGVMSAGTAAADGSESASLVNRLDLHADFIEGVLQATNNDD